MIRRYLFLRHLVVTLVLLGFVVLALTLGQFADSARHIGPQDGAQALWLLWRAVLRTPMLLQYALPHVVIIATIVLLHRLGEQRELAILAGVGLSGWQIVAPLILSGVVVGAGYVLILNPLASAGIDHAERIDREVLGIRDRPGARNIATATEHGMAYIFASSASAGGDWLQDVTIYEMDQSHRLTRRIEFDRAERSVSGVWAIEGYAEAEGSARIAPTPPPAALPFDLDLLFTQLGDRQATALLDLPRAAARARSIAAQPLPYLMQFHWLLALPALLGALSLAAGAVGLRLRPDQHWTRRALDVLALAFPVYVLITVIEAAAIRGLVPPAAAAWGLPAILALVALAGLRLRGS